MLKCHESDIFFPLISDYPWKMVIYPWKMVIYLWKMVIYPWKMVIFHSFLMFFVCLPEGNWKIMVLWWFIYIILLYIRDGLVSYPYRFNWGISESMNGESRFSTNLCMFSGFEHCSIAMTRYSIMFFDGDNPELWQTQVWEHDKW